MAIIVTIGEDSSNNHYGDTPAGDGDVSPDNVDGNNIDYCYVDDDGGTFALQLDGEHPQDYFNFLDVEGVGTLDQSDAFYSQSGGNTSWAWAPISHDWASDVGGTREVDVDGGVDETPPSFVEATVQSSGNEFRIEFDEDIYWGTDGRNGFTIDFDGGPATLENPFGSEGFPSIDFDISRNVGSNETGTLSFVQPGDGIQDAAGNLVADFGPVAITNNSGLDNPTLDSATVDSTGTVLTLNFSEAVTSGSDGLDLFTLSTSAGDVTPTYDSGDTTATFSYNISTAILENETITLSYDWSFEGIRDTDNADRLLGIEDMSVTNNSTVAPPEVDSASINSVGDTLSITFTANVTAGADGFDDVTMDMSGNSVTATYQTGDGSDTLNYSLSRFILQSETGTFDYTQPGDGIQGTNGVAIQSVSNEPITNNSTETAPTVTNLEINSAGDTFIVTLSETVTSGADGFSGFSLSFTEGSVSATYDSGDNSDTLTYSLSRHILQSESGTADFTQPGDGIQDDNEFNLQSFSGESVTNNSTETPPEIEEASITLNGDMLIVRFDESVTAGDDDFSGFSLSLSGGSITATYDSGDDTNALNYTLSRVVDQGEEGTLDYDQPGDGIQDSVGNLLASSTGHTINNGSLVQPPPEPEEGPLSQAGLQAVLASATKQIFLECLTIEHSNMETIRIVNNTEDLERDVGTFSRFPFVVTGGNQSVDRPPSIEVTADAIDQRLITAIRQTSTDLRERAQIKYEVVLADTPNTVEYGPVEFEMDGVTSNGHSTLSIRASFLFGALNDAFPGLQFTPSNTFGSPSGDFDVPDLYLNFNKDFYQQGIVEIALDDIATVSGDTVEITDISWYNVDQGSWILLAEGDSGGADILTAGNTSIQSDSVDEKIYTATYDTDQSVSAVTIDTTYVKWLLYFPEQKTTSELELWIDANA